MIKKSDFIYDYIQRLNEKEIYKLTAMLEADKRMMELNLLRVFRITKTYNEPALVKASKMKKASFQTVKSQLKSYMLSTGGYQDKVANQILLESISCAQGLLRKGFIETGEEELRRLDAFALTQGAHLYSAVALGLITWSHIFNKKIDIASTHIVLDSIANRLEQELIAVPVVKVSMVIEDIVTRDSGLRRPTSKTTIQNLFKNPVLKHSSHPNFFAQSIKQFAKGNMYTLSRKFDKSIQAIEPILQSVRYPSANKNPVSYELSLMYERQSYSALRSHNMKLIKQYTVFYTDYIDMGFSRVDAQVASSELHRCWYHIQLKNIAQAQVHFTIALSKFNSAQNRITTQQIYDFLTRAMLISLNMSKTARYELMKLVVMYKFEYEWNEAYDMNYKILNLFTDWDDTVNVRGDHFTIKNDTLATNAARLKDNIRKKYKYDDYEFELGLCTLFLNIKTDTKKYKIHSLFRKYIKNTLTAENMNKYYVKQYFDFFDFKKWAEGMVNLSAK